MSFCPEILLREMRQNVARAFTIKKEAVPASPDNLVLTSRFS